MSYLKLTTLLMLAILTPQMAEGQMTAWFQWTFLPGEQMDEIIGEASGETAYNHVMEMGGYNRDRQADEYAGTLFEAQYMLDRMKEYGLAGARIETFGETQTWDGIKGELWEVAPIRQKLASFTDLRCMLASGSANADVQAELAWVGEGGREDFEGLDVEGKIVVTSGSAGGVHNIACGQMGAAGVVSFNSPRPLVDPLIMPTGGIRGRGGETKFAFYLPPREGHILRDRLSRGQKITVHAQVEAAMRTLSIQDPVCHIAGTDPEAGEIIFSAHLFEGYAKQGANDNFSGCAAILEMARTLNVLINEGRLERPKRTIRFLWGPEFSGTGPWVQANKELMEKTLCNINLDMVGLQLNKSLAYMTLMRTTYGNPHYINDVMENYYRYVGETNRSYVVNGMGHNSFTRRIVAPSGTEEPMHYYMGTHMGSSDHEVFNDWGVGVPGVVMNTWPDIWYHTSEDRIDKLDPTQMKRCVVMGAGAAYTIASADDYMARQIAAEIVSNASARLGHQLARGLEELKRVEEAKFGAAYKKVCGYIEAAGINERATLETVKQLAEDKKQFDRYLRILKGSVREIEQAHMSTLEVYMSATADRLRTAPAIITLTELEEKAAGIIPKPTSKITRDGYRGYQQHITQARQEMEQQPRGRSLRNAAEVQLLCDGINSALDIKKLCDTQFAQETDLQAILSHLELLKQAGLIEM